jgi:hypothetical protein
MDGLGRALQSSVLYSVSRSPPECAIASNVLSGLNAAPRAVDGGSTAGSGILAHVSVSYISRNGALADATAK